MPLYTANFIIYHLYCCQSIRRSPTQIFDIIEELQNGMSDDALPSTFRFCKRCLDDDGATSNSTTATIIDKGPPPF